MKLSISGCQSSRNNTKTMQSQISKEKPVEFIDLNKKFKRQKADQTVNKKLNITDKSKISQNNLIKTLNSTFTARTTQNHAKTNKTRNETKPPALVKSKKITSKT